MVSLDLILQIVNNFCKNGYLSSLLHINIRVPQGSVLGPILFLININHLSNCSNFTTTLYANDSVLTLSHKNVNCLRTMVRIALIKMFISSKLFV